jgi:hypothetical protein
MLDLIGSIGNASYIYPAILAIAFSTIIVAYGIYNNRFLDIAPTFAWALLMQAPFILQSGFYNSEPAQMQSYGIFIMSFLIISGDCYSLFHKNYIQHQNTIVNIKPLLVVCILGLIFFPLYHLSHIESTPFFDRLLGDFELNEIAQKREMFGKNLNVNIFYKYTFQWVYTVFGPIAFTLLMIQKKYIFALAVCIWVVIYSVLSTAKLPILLFLIFSALGISQIIPAILRKIIGATVFIIGAVFLFVSIERTGEINSWYVENRLSNLVITNFNETLAAKDPLRQLTLNDVERVDGVKIEGAYSPEVNFFIYRIFLSPADVSNHWYTFYEHVATEKRSAWDLIKPPKVGELRASNLVGRWAYYERFPHKYLETISAYGSIDADAYSFGGLICVLLVGFIYLALRIYTIRLGAHAIGKFLSPIMTGYFVIFLAQSSLQAILVAQGLLMLIVISFCYLAGGLNVKFFK